MPEVPNPALVDAKQRLDTLIARAHDQFLMPITIAEVLRKINEGAAGLDDIGHIKKKSTAWCGAVKQRLFRRYLSQNASYKDKLYSGHMPVSAIEALSSENRRTSGIVEAYVYARLRQTVDALGDIRETLVRAAINEFSLAGFLTAFDSNPKLKRNVAQAYEIVVHALFNTIATRVRAQVTVSISTDDAAIIADFQDFCQLLLDVDAAKPTVTVQARLYRVGGANSRDGGVDLWANFGPAIQVKHIALNVQNAPPIVDSVSAEQVVIVCKDADKNAIQAVLAQGGFGGRVRGIITKSDLTRWYGLALSPRHFVEMAGPLFKALLAEFDDEFALADPTEIDLFAKERGYDKLRLEGTWSVDQPVTRAAKPKKSKSDSRSVKKKGT